MKRVLRILCFFILFATQSLSAQNKDENTIVYFSNSDANSIFWFAIDLESRDFFSTNKIILDPEAHKKTDSLSDLPAIMIIQKDKVFQSHSLKNYSFIRMVKQNGEANNFKDSLEIPLELKDKLGTNTLQMGDRFSRRDYDEHCLISCLSSFRISSRKVLESNIDCSGIHILKSHKMEIFLISGSQTEKIIFSETLIRSKGSIPVRIDLKDYEKGDYLVKVKIGNDSRYYPVFLK